MVCVMINGTVRWYSNKNGIGFISQKHGDDVFIHRNAIQGIGPKTLSRGDAVEFEMEDDQESNKASKVVIL